MTLYKKTLVILAITFACLLLVLYLASRYILLDGYSEIERAEAAENSQRALNIIGDDLRSLADASRDWADSSDTYAFVTAGGNEYVEAHLADADSWVNNGVNAMVFTDADGRVIYAGGFDLENRRFAPLPEGFVDQALHQEPLAEQPEADSALFGIVSLPGGPMMVSSVPVTRSGFDESAAGNLVWGRFLDQSEIDRIAGITLTAVTISSADGELPADMEAALERLRHGDSGYFVANGPNLSSYSLINDINDEQALIMRVETPRDVYQQGELSIFYLIAAVVAVGVFFVLVIVTLLNRLVIRRTRAISEGVRRAAKTGKISERLDIEGSDELALLSADINRLLKALELSHESLGRINIELGERVTEKTTQLYQKVAVLEALADIDREIIAAHDSDAIQNLICQRTSALLGVPKVIIVLRSRDGLGQMSSSYGLDVETPNYDELGMLFRAHIISRLGLDGKEAVGYDEVTAYDFCMPDLIARENIYSLAIAPLHADSQLMGAMLILDTKPHEWSGEELQILNLLANQVALGVDAARLFEEEKVRREELTALYQLSRNLADAAPDIDTVLAIVSRTAVETINVTYCRIALLMEDELFMRSAYPRRVLGRNLTVGYSEPISSLSYCQRVLKQDAPVVIRTGQQVLDSHEREVLFLDGAQSICLVPLKTANKPLGLMILGEVRHEKREPLDADKIELARSIGDQAASTLKRAELFIELEHAFMQTVLSLAKAVDARDEYTSDHGQVMSHMALAVGRMLNMSPMELESLHYASILHDVGKIGIADAILQKPARLTEEEWAQMKKHPAVGEQIMSPVPFLEDASMVVRHHHEHYDGSGYPDKLMGEAIPLGARILAVVDAYSAMRDKRVYKNAMTHDEAIRELHHCTGTQFDPIIVKTFIRLLNSGIINTDNRLGHHVQNGGSKKSEEYPSGEGHDDTAAA